VCHPLPAVCPIYSCTHTHCQQNARVERTMDAVALSLCSTPAPANCTPTQYTRLQPAVWSTFNTHSRPAAVLAFKRGLRIDGCRIHEIYFPTSRKAAAATSYYHALDRCRSIKIDHPNLVYSRPVCGSKSVPRSVLTLMHNTQWQNTRMSLKCKQQQMNHCSL